MEKTTEQIFDEILKEASEGQVCLPTTTENSSWKFFVRFFDSTSKNLPQDTGLFPILKITNKKTLLEKIENYLSDAKEFYSFEQEHWDLSDEGFEKKLIFDLFINASASDFENFMPYVDLRSEQLHVHFSKKPQFLGKYEDLSVFGKIEKSMSNLESPYKFEIQFRNENDKYVLPKIYFGIDHDKNIHVYAIQNKKELEKTPLFKKLDRHFRAVNKNVDPEDEIAKVSPSSLVALTIFASYFESFEMNNLIFHSYMPLRYQSHKSTADLKTNNIELATEEADRIEFNTTNKLLNCASRFAFHFPNSEFNFNDYTGQATLKVDTLFPEYENDEELEKLEDNIIVYLPNIVYNQTLKKILEMRASVRPFERDESPEKE